MKKIIPIRSVSEVKSSVTDGTKLQVSEAQFEALKGNYQVLVNTIKVESNMVNNPAVSLAGEDDGYIEPFKGDVPIINQGEIVNNSNSILNTTNPIPTSVEPNVIEPNVIDNNIKVENNKVAPPVTGPEIISNEEPKENIFEVMQNEINGATKEYNDKIMAIFDKYKKKINDSIDMANNYLDEAKKYKADAQELLKNAQAATQIADITRQNAEMLQRQKAA